MIHTLATYTATKRDLHVRSSVDTHDGHGLPTLTLNVTDPAAIEALIDTLTDLALLEHDELVRAEYA